MNTIVEAERLPVVVSDASHSPVPNATRRPRERWVAASIGLVLVAWAIWALRRDLALVPYDRVRALSAAIPSARLVLAAALTAACYLAMCGYDALALRYAASRLSPARTAFVSFVAYAFSQNIGLSALTGASIRYRFWSTWGLSAEEIAKGVAFTTGSFWVGVLLVGGLTLIVAPLSQAVGLPVGANASRALGVALLLPVVIYLVWTIRSSGPLAIRTWRLSPPRLSVALAQLAVSGADWVLAGAVLYALLPNTPGLTLARFLGVFLLAQIVGLISHVPGGLSVFESVVLLLLKSYLPMDRLLASLVVYRAIYYLLPLLLAMIALAVYEVYRKRSTVLRTLQSTRNVVAAAAPFWLGAATFAAGLVLLFSGSTPSVHSRMRWLDVFLPLGVMEVSHFVASIAGVGLLILANGLRRRLDAAYHMSVAVLVVGIVTSVLKGFDWEEALVLTVALSLLLPARRHFYRRAALLAEPMSRGWIVSIALALGATLWLGLFSYKHIDYSASLWWRFASTADAPRFLRASVGIAVAVILFAAARLLRTTVPRIALPSEDDLVRAKHIALGAHGSEANLALLGDKTLLFSRSGRSFIQYGVMKRSWVALGDPVGDPSEFSELVRDFTKLADRHGAFPVFYEVDRAYLPIYIDLGLTLLKLGEAARVRLPDYSLEGGARKPQRRLVKEVERMGATFAVIPASEVPLHLNELRAVSDDWLDSKRTREKGFSLGYFDDEYLAHFPVAVVKVGERIVAFANVWTSGGREELSVDLMRFSRNAPRSVMEYLFVQLMLWGKSEGFRWFCLGMAPLSGLESHALAPVWNRVGDMLFRRGEFLSYNFRGLRQYKEKFDPVWEPKYLASKAGLALPRILINVTSLISGGLRGVVAR